MVENFNIIIPQYAKKALKVLEKNGFEAWIVGGFVRDAIISNNNVNNSDIDIATNAHPNQVKQAFNNKEWTVYNLGIKFGTIGIINKNSNHIIEITTYRKESNYINGRHPSALTFKTDIYHDLSRRDFTCNAIAFNPKYGILDPYNGIDDIHKKIIKTVNDPKQRFKEDYLRILRALRFSSQLNFNIEDATKHYICKYKDKILKISNERIREEMNKLLCGINAKSVLINYKDIIFEIIPELRPLDGYDQKTKYHSYDIYTHTVITVNKINLEKYKTNKENNFITAKIIGKWAALLHDIGKPNCATFDKNGQGHYYNHPKESTYIAENILKRLKFSNKIRNCILLLIRWHDHPMAPTKKSINKMLRKFEEAKCFLNTYDIFRIYCDLRRADSYAHAIKYRENLYLTNKIEKIFEQIISEENVFTIKDLNINGNDILNLGVLPGPIISEILNECLKKVIEDELNNNNEQLINFVKEYIKCRNI